MQRIALAPQPLSSLDPSARVDDQFRWAARRAGALQRALRWLDGVAGGLFIVFGVRLALTQAPGAR